jgi:hypothetical protein
LLLRDCGRVDAFLEVAHPLVIPLPRATLNEAARPEREFMLVPTSFTAPLQPRALMSKMMPFGSLRVQPI